MTKFSPGLAVAISISAAVAIFAAVSQHAVLLAIFKSLTTVLIISAFWFEVGRVETRFATLMLVGLMFCLAGDVLLLDESRFVLGLSAFLLAHLLFLSAFVVVRGWQRALTACVLLLLVSGVYWWHLQPFLGDLLVAVTLYTCVIMVMSWQGLGLASALPGRDTAAIGIGALLFVFSDATIAWNKFVSPFDASPVIILGTYWLAIYLIASGGAQLHHRLQKAG